MMDYGMDELLLVVDNLIAGDKTVNYQDLWIVSVQFALNAVILTEVWGKRGGFDDFQSQVVYLSLTFK